ncbi:EXD1 family protein [Megaselia abdita]
MMSNAYVIINLAQESFMGRIVDCNEQWVTLDNLTENKTGRKLPGQQRFITNHIIEIKEIENAQETLRLEKMIKNAWYIYQMDEKYHKMIEALRTKTVFAMLSENVNFGRNSRMTILCFATEDNIFILDFINFQKIHKDLKVILEDNSILKVIFDSGKICDYFKYHQKIQIEGIFDPMIIENTGYDILQNVIKKHFQVDVDDGQAKNWSIRPLNSFLKYSTAKKTIYLRKLYNIQLLAIVENIENRISHSSTLHSSSETTSSEHEQSYITANQSSYSKKDDYVGEILVIRMEHEILVGECTQNSKYYLKLKNVINAKNGISLQKQELYKKHMISVDRINNSKSHNRRSEQVKTNNLQMHNFKVNRCRPQMFISKKNQKFKEALSDIQRRWFICLFPQEHVFQILTESTIYIFDIKFMDLLKSILATVKAVKILYSGVLKLSGFLDLKIIPDIIPFDEFAEKYVELSAELIYENEIVIFEVYFIFIIKSLFASVFLKCRNYAQFYCKNEDWVQVSLQMSQRTIPDL